MSQGTHPHNPLPGNDSGRPYWEWAGSVSLPSVGGGGMTAGERSPPQAEQGQQRKREEEKKVPMAGAEHRGSEREGALRAWGAEWPLPLSPQQNKLIFWASSLPVFSLPCSFFQAVALGLPDTPAWNARSRTSVPSLRAMVKRGEKIEWKGQHVLLTFSLRTS